MFDNYAEETLKAANEVGLYKKLKIAWFVLTTILVYVWCRALFYDRSHANICQVQVGP